MQRYLTQGQRRGPAGRGLPRLAGALLLLLDSACGDPPDVLGDYGRRPGAGCGDLASECVDEATLWACVARRWELVDCAEACEERGGVVGCLANPALPTGARCWCGDDVAACTPGQAECVSDDLVQVCDPETLEFVESSCEAVCAAWEPPQLPTYCSAGECGCTLAGTPCASESSPRCELTTLARCVEGVWDVESCECSAGCDPWAPGGAACGC